RIRAPGSSPARKLSRAMAAPCAWCERSCPEPTRTCLYSPSSLPRRDDIQRTVAADRRAISPVTREPHAKVYLFRTGIDHLLIIPLGAPPIRRLTATRSHQVVVIGRCRHHGDFA